MNRDFETVPLLAIVFALMGIICFCKAYK